jgi:hypothetical protein
MARCTIVCDLDDVVQNLEQKFRCANHVVSSKDLDFELLQPNFAWAPVDVIKRTFDITTRWAQSIKHHPFRKHFKSRFPAFNVHRQNKPVATNTVYSDTPAIDSGATSAQIFVGTKSLVTDVYGMKLDKEFVNTLQDVIRKSGAMEKLISDRAQTELSNNVLDILQNYIIDNWQSEPYHKHQNPAERRYQTIKTYTSEVLDRTGTPACTWLLVLLYVCYLFNHMAAETLDWQTPHTTAHSDRYNHRHFCSVIFPLLEPVFYATAVALKYEAKPGFPSETAEARGRFVGFGVSVGDVLTYKILTDETEKIIYRSYVRSALKKGELNRRLDPTGGEPKPIVEIVKSPRVAKGEPGRTLMIIIRPEEIINRTYLTEPNEQGQRYRAKIVQKIVENEASLAEQPEHIKFLVSIEGDKADKIVAYNNILDYLEEALKDDSPAKI